MLLRTHVALTVFVILLFAPLVENRIVFAFVALIAGFLPDLDSGTSAIGRKVKWVFWIFTKHRGFIHSFTFLFLITVLFALFFPIGAFGFFLGFGTHLLADSFTVEGISPFWPWEKKSKGIFRTGSFSETVVFALLIGASFILMLRLF